MKKFFLLALAAGCSLVLSAQPVKITVHGDTPGAMIPAEIYGQFAEHLGSCIYGGLWVGPESDIPNIDGYRKDVFEALKDLEIPVLRWPGGCFADDYHWRDGIGPRENRPKLVNNNWGGTVEDNSFGTHEFLNLCELLGCEPYISGNVGSGTVEELSDWVEYMTAGEGSPLARLRAENGRKEPWKVKYVGVGNEAWGCGGDMRPEYYSDLYRRYATYMRDFDGNHLFKVASGASGYDYNWTRVLMDRIGTRMDGVSVHYYSNLDWNNKGSATNFDTASYYTILAKCHEVEDVLREHIAVMDAYDPKNEVALLLDEWGTWFDVEPGTNPGHLFQQNTMRDAMVASISLDIFHKYTQRLKMANIAQVANVLQAMVLTRGNKMLLTPTYHVFKMYKVHKGAQLLPTDIEDATVIPVNEGWRLQLATATASKAADGKVHVSVSNLDAEKAHTVVVQLDGIDAKKAVAEILHGSCIQDHNTFEEPGRVHIAPFKAFKLKGQLLTLELPAASIVTVELQ